VDTAAAAQAGEVGYEGGWDDFMVLAALFDL